MRIASTMMVYGCLSASLTIHMIHIPFPSGVTGLH
jgi:hypothetical protein